MNVCVCMQTWVDVEGWNEFDGFVKSRHVGCSLPPLCETAVHTHINRTHTHILLSVLPLLFLPDGYPLPADRRAGGVRDSGYCKSWHTHTHTHTHIMHIHTHTNTCMHSIASLHAHAVWDSCMRKQKHTHQHTHTHTHTHTPTRTHLHTATD